jgi:pimeloyl-ACP methyl ester carboxylesterase
LPSTWLDCAPRWRGRLGELAVPTLVLHGAADPFFPVGNGEALAAEIPDARLLVLDDMGSALRDAAAEKVANAMLTLRLLRRTRAKRFDAAPTSGGMGRPRAAS